MVLHIFYHPPVLRPLEVAFRNCSTQSSHGYTPEIQERADFAPCPGGLGESLRGSKPATRERSRSLFVFRNAGTDLFRDDVELLDSELLRSEVTVTIVCFCSLLLLFLRNDLFCLHFD
jgi:hypothetical protein